MAVAPPVSWPIYVLVALNALVLGGAIMAFEMVSSRFISPYFGGGIFTWGAIIATVLSGMSVGYVVGGIAADRLHGVGRFGVFVVLAGIVIAYTPELVDATFPVLMDNVLDVRVASLLGAIVVLALPTFILAMHSPFEIRLLLRSTQSAGRVVGTMNGIATSGAIVGTLGTSFILIPSYGSKALSVGIGVMVALAGLLYVLVQVMVSRYGTSSGE